MPKYLIAYRKTEESGQKPEWAVFTTDSDLSLEAHAVKERVEKRMSVLGEKLWGNGEALWIGNGRLDDVLYRRDEAPPEMSIVYGAGEAHEPTGPNGPTFARSSSSAPPPPATAQRAGSPDSAPRPPSLLPARAS